MKSDGVPRLCLTPELVARFRAYHEANPVWGRLHIVLSDGNYQDDCVRHAIQWAIDVADPEGKELAELLLQMSRTQRIKLSRIT